MRKHILFQSYHRVEYKCEECDFYGTEDLAMEIHYRKTHNDQFECGLCDNEFARLICIFHKQVKGVHIISSVLTL